MIQADRQELETRLKQVTLQIREKEILVFTDNFAVLSTQSAFLTGLGFGGLTMVPTWANDENAKEAIFYTLVSISIGFNILTLCISSWCMIFGPGLAIRGPDGSMSRAVEGMYAERKWALRFFWMGLLFIMCSGIALSWLKFHSRTASVMTVLFVVFLFSFFLYVKLVTRPRFRFPKDAERRPGEFRVAGLNPETGRHDDDFSGSSTSSRKKREAAEREAASRRMVNEIQWLQQQGVLTEEEAAEKLAKVEERFSQLHTAGSSGRLTLRHRVFGSNADKTSFASTVAPPPPAASSVTRSASSPLVTQIDTPSPPSSGMPKTPPPQSPAKEMPMTAVGVWEGLVNKNGKLTRFSVTDTTITFASLDGSGKKEHSTVGQVLTCTMKSSVSHPFMFILGIGKTTFKLEANSEPEMREWLARFPPAN